MPKINNKKVEGRECLDCKVFKTWDNYAKAGHKAGKQIYKSRCRGCTTKGRGNNNLEKELKNTLKEIKNVSNSAEKPSFKSFVIPEEEEEKESKVKINVSDKPLREDEEIIIDDILTEKENEDYSEKNVGSISQKNKKLEPPSDDDDFDDNFYASLQEPDSILDSMNNKNNTVYLDDETLYDKPSSLPPPQNTPPRNIQQNINTNITQQYRDLPPEKPIASHNIPPSVIPEYPVPVLDEKLVKKRKKLLSYMDAYPDKATQLGLNPKRININNMTEENIDKILLQFESGGGLKSISNFFKLGFDVATNCMEYFATTSSNIKNYFFMDNYNANVMKDSELDDICKRLAMEWYSEFEEIISPESEALLFLGRVGVETHNKNKQKYILIHQQNQDRIHQQRVEQMQQQIRTQNEQNIQPAQPAPTFILETRPTAQPSKATSSSTSSTPSAIDRLLKKVDA